MNALFSLELRAVRRARWFAVSLLVSCLLVGFFLVVAARESAVLGFTGFGKVLGGVVQVSLLLLPLVALASTAQAVTAARQAGVLEWYLSQPVSRDTCFRALFLPRLGALVVPVALTLGVLGLAAFAMGQPVSLSLLGVFLAVLVGQVLAFGAMGMWISTRSRAPEHALLAAVGVWMATAVLVDFVLLGVMLQWDLAPWLVFLLAGLNPMQDGRVAVLAAVDPQMGALGPVGTWAVGELGAAGTLAVTLSWPYVLALAFGLLARREFLRRDAL